MAESDEGEWVMGICEGERTCKSFEAGISPRILAQEGPRSPCDNKEVWKKYNYRELGIIAESYFDLDFSKVLYLADTGRRWNGEGVSIRDKAHGVKSEKAKMKIISVVGARPQFIKLGESGNLLFPDSSAVF